LTAGKIERTIVPDWVFWHCFQMTTATLLFLVARLIS
jgi:hypothetical protein